MNAQRSVGRLSVHRELPFAKGRRSKMNCTCQEVKLSEHVRFELPALAGGDAQRDAEPRDPVRLKGAYLYPSDDGNTTMSRCPWSNRCDGRSKVPDIVETWCVTFDFWHSKQWRAHSLQSFLTEARRKVM